MNNDLRANCKSIFSTKKALAHYNNNYYSLRSLSSLLPERANEQSKNKQPSSNQTDTNRLVLYQPNRCCCYPYDALIATCFTSDCGGNALVRLFLHHSSFAPRRSLSGDNRLSPGASFRSELMNDLTSFVTPTAAARDDNDYYDVLLLSPGNWLDGFITMLSQSGSNKFKRNK